VFRKSCSDKQPNKEQGLCTEHHKLRSMTLWHAYVLSVSVHKGNFSRGSGPPKEWTMRILLKRQAADCFKAAANIEEGDWYIKAAYTSVRYTASVGYVPLLAKEGIKHKVGGDD
jgi:hypothetical protein